MALRLHWVPIAIPSTFFRDKHSPTTLTIQHKPSSQNPFFVSSLSFSNSSSSSSISPVSAITSNNSSRSKKNRNLLVFQVSSSIQEQTQTETQPTTVEIPTTSSENEPRTRVLAENIPWTSTIEDIRILFEKHGTVIDVEIPLFGKKKNRGLAFVTMGSEEEAVAALTNLQSYEYEGRVIKMTYAYIQKQKKPVETKFTIFVGNLSLDVTSEDLREFFSSMNVISTEVIKQETAMKRPIGCGFVSFGSREEAMRAISTFKGKMLLGRPIRLEFSRKKRKGGLKKNSNEPTQLDGTSTEVNGEGLSQNGV